jgi:hypothetical protein
LIRPTERLCADPKADADFADWTDCAETTTTTAGAPPTERHYSHVVGCRLGPGFGCWLSALLFDVFTGCCGGICAIGEICVSLWIAE